MLTSNVLLVGPTLQWARGRLAGSPSAHLDAQLLLGFVLGQSRPWVLSHPDAALEASDRIEYERLIERRVTGEPVGYIRGQVEWCGLALEVNPAVLIPRPETELVAEEAVNLARERGARFCVDVGTGSGAIAIWFAMQITDCLVFGVDFSEHALAVASRNAARHGVSSRIDFRHGNLLDRLTLCPDLVIANLPYLSDAMMQELPGDVRYEPADALYGGPGGLELYAAMFSQLTERDWSPDMVLEIDPRESHDMVGLVYKYFPDADCDVRADYAGLHRTVVVRGEATRG